jgi:hypothetical protein
MCISLAPTKPVSGRRNRKQIGIAICMRLQTRKHSPASSPVLPVLLFDTYEHGGHN